MAAHRLPGPAHDPLQVGHPWLIECISNLKFSKVGCSHFSGIVDLVHTKCDHQTLIKHLKEVCYLVCGVWVIKSDLLYKNVKTTSVSAISDVNSKKLISARDYLLGKINKDGFVNRKDFSTVAKIPSSEVNFIMNPICKNNLNQGWTLKIDQDNFFIKK